MQRRQRHLARAREVQVVVGAAGRSAARCRAGSRCRTAPPRAPAPAGRPARSRARRARSSAQRTSASSSSTRSPLRYAKREPATRAPASMSIIAPASSRWSRPAPSGLADLAQRRVVVGGGRVGRVRERRRARPAARRRRPPAPAPSAFTRAATSCIAAISSAASPPACLARADRLRRLVLARAQRLDLGPQRARARVELEHAVEPRVGAVAPARQRRPHGLGVAADLLEVEHRAAPRPLPGPRRR